MSQALTAPFLLAAAVLWVAGVAKLRSPDAAAHALRTLGIPVDGAAVRVLAVAEVGLATWSALAPGTAAGLTMAGTYGVFALVSLRLAQARHACGCFGEAEAPATLGQALLSATLGTACLLGAFAAVRGMPWVLTRPAPSAVVLVAGIAGATYAAVLVYTQLPRAWSAWSTG